MERDTKELSLRSELHRLISEFFTEEDLQQAAFDIGVDWDDVPGTNKSAKIRNLITWLEDRGRLYRLVGYCQRERPKIDWTGFG